MEQAITGVGVWGGIVQHNHLLKLTSNRIYLCIDVSNELIQCIAICIIVYVY